MNYSNFSVLAILTILLFSSSCKKDDSSALKVEARFTTPIIEYGVVTFKNYSLNATDYLWEFEDGNTSTEKDPIHEYETIGIFDVKLTASNGAESDVFFLKVAIGQIFPDNLTELDPLPFGRRDQMTYFTIDDKGYVLGGYDFTTFNYALDLWEFDSNNKSWNHVTNNLPSYFINSISFTANEQGYFGLGNGANAGSEAYKIYKFNPSTSEVEFEIDFIGDPSTEGIISDAVTFVFENNVFLIGRGFNDFEKRMWKYDLDNQIWTNIGNYLCEGNSGMYHFVIDGKLYIGGGNKQYYSFVDCESDFWEYDIDNNSWTQKNDFPGGARRDGISFTYNGNGYFGFGADFEGTTGKQSNFSDLWKYDIASDSWEKIADLPVPNNQNLFRFVFGNTLYFGGGNSGQGGATARFYEYTLD